MSAAATILRHTSLPRLGLGESWMGEQARVPVHEAAGCVGDLRFVRMTGCTAVRPSPWFRGFPLMLFLKGLPSRSASWRKNLASCVAVKPSSIFCIGGDSLS